LGTDAKSVNGIQCTPLTRYRAFTLIEILIVVAILALLLTIMFPAARLAYKAAKDTEAKALAYRARVNAEMGIGGVYGGIYNALQFGKGGGALNEMPPDEELGMSPIKVYYNGAIWSDGNPKPYPEEGTIRALARKMPTDRIVVLDIENWTDPDQAVENFKNVATWIRQENPNVQFGFYAEMPPRNYWAAQAGPGDPKWDEWQKRAEKYKEAAVLVDFVFPSLYCFYEDREGWVTYAKANIEMARMYGKPVLPFIWMQYHPGGPRPLEPIEGDFFGLQVKTVLEHADGVVLWGGWGHSWDPNAPWWQATMGAGF